FNMTVMESPVCLIENKDGTLRMVTEETGYLMRINQPVVIVVVVGLYCTGKSYLMSKLAGERKGGADFHSGPHSEGEELIIIYFLVNIKSK
uniref:Guanylate-binding protein N-terminal domain-containing protein n=1 Tax=Scleropages formosus TaxID=113540 RepID=A0A8C9WRV6_SCLFO